MNWSQAELDQKQKDNPELRIDTSGSPLPRFAAAVNKYHTAPKEKRTYNGVVYASKKEALFAQEQDQRQKAGLIDFWLRQIPFPLPADYKYRLDFAIFKLVENTHFYEIHWYEVKGYETQLGLLKRKQTEELYHILIEVI